MRVLVCGGRGYMDFKTLTRVLDEIKPTVIINGDAPGADGMSSCYGQNNGIPVISVRAQWDYYDRAAGPIRNAWMLEHCKPIDLVVAFPGKAGTANMVKQAKEAGIPVREIKK